MRRAWKVPFTAMLSDSVPPEVKSTSEGRTPSASAIRSRDSSTTRRAARPGVCNELALPTCRMVRVTTSTTSSSTGVVAAWSR